MTTSAQHDLPSRARMEQQRDQALRDLLELEQQVRAGEVPPGPAAKLRRRYERAAAEALTLLDGTETVRSATPRRKFTWRAVVYGAGGLAALVALAVVLPPALQERPDGGFVTGNEVIQAGPAPQPTSSATGRDLSEVSNAEMEQVVAANPDVVGMRLALAERYRVQGEYTKAVPHYREVLDRQPDNAGALASLGWVLLMLEGGGEDAARFADEAVQQDPALPFAWWVQANVRLFGQDDPDGATESLREMRELPLEPDVQEQVAALEQEARARAAAGGGE